MRHRKAGRRLGRQGSHRTAMLRNLVTSLLVHERVTTTLANAKEAKRLTDRLITLGKAGSVVARRRAFAIVADRTVVRRLFTEIAPRLNGHRGGYTRVLRLRRRTGDNAELALLELTRLAPVTSPPAGGAVKGKKAAASAAPTVSKEKPSKVPAEPKTDSAAPSETPSAQRKKPASAAPASEEAAPASEEQTPPPSKKGFMDGLRKFFKK